MDNLITRDNIEKLECFSQYFENALSYHLVVAEQCYMRIDFYSTDDKVGSVYLNNTKLNRLKTIDDIKAFLSYFGYDFDRI